MTNPLNGLKKYLISLFQITCVIKHKKYNYYIIICLQKHLYWNEREKPKTYYNYIVAMNCNDIALINSPWSM